MEVYASIEMDPKVPGTQYGPLTVKFWCAEYDATLLQTPCTATLPSEDFKMFAVHPPCQWLFPGALGLFLFQGLCVRGSVKNVARLTPPEGLPNRS